MARARAEWRGWQPGLDPGRLAFLDEAWATTGMARLHGRGPRGGRVVGAVPAGRWRAATFVAGLRADGLVAPMALEGAMNGAAFLACVAQALAPTLPRGGVVALDGLGGHKVAGVREAVEARGASLLHLPPHPPDLNPAEQAFAKLEALLRKAAARTLEAPVGAVAGSLGRFAPAECADYLANSGYPRSA